MNKINELTTEELIELAQEETDEEQNVVLKPHVSDFIKEYEILPGSTLVPTYVIFYHYRRKWRMESRNKLSKVDFFRNFSKVFDQKRKTKNRFYLLNDGSFDLSELSLKLSKDSDNIYEARQKNKKKKQKKLKQIS